MARSLNAHQIPKGWQYELLDKLAERCSGHTLSTGMVVSNGYH